MSDGAPSKESQAVLGLTLDVAVPLWVARLQQHSWGYVQDRARVCGQTIAEKGDVLQFKSKGTANAFNHLAEGLACLSFAPGGVHFMGRHWVSHHPGGS